MSGTDYLRPGSLSEAYAVLESHPSDELRVLMGGTDVVVGLRHGSLRPRVLVDLKHLVDLPSTIDQVGDRISISASTTLTQLIADARVRRHFPALVQAAQTIGSVQIRNRASLAGNICNASPAYDTATPLLVHGAEVVLGSSAGTRRVPVGDFVLGPRNIDRRPGEIVVAVELPLPAERLGTDFARLTRRRGVDLATLNLCVAVSDQVTTYAFGAVAPRPFLVVDDVGVLADSASTANDRDAVLREMTSRATPIDDVRAGADYRRAMLLIFARRSLDAALARRDQVPA